MAQSIIFVICSLLSFLVITGGRVLTTRTVNSSNGEIGLPSTTNINYLPQNLPSDRHNWHRNAVQHFCINSTVKVYDSSLITCTSNGSYLASGFCATYTEDTKMLSIASCAYFRPRAKGYDTTKRGKILVHLPSNLSQLNNYMCGPLNRKGLVCSECADGFGPSVTSFGYECVNCTNHYNAFYGLSLFFLLEFVPITALYLIILAFRISIVSAPMPCFIMYAQWVVVAFYLSIYEDNSLREAIFTERGHLRLDMQIMHIFYGVFNLDFFQFLKPSICISSKLKTVHVALLGYISVLYPLLLIFLTWVCIRLYGRNFRLLVWLWKPFHRCFVRLRKGWDTKSDIIDVFATFFMLSYCRCAYQTILLLSSQEIRSFNDKGEFCKVEHRAIVDISVKVGSREHLIYVIPAATFFLVYNILPPLLIILYPFKIFRLCLSKCHLDFIAINTFFEKLSGSYRNGLDGRSDVRSLAGLYFFLRMAVYLVGYSSYKLLRKYTDNIWIINEIWFPSGTMFLLTALTIALVKPYQKTYMAYTDALLLSNLALCCFAVTSKVFVFITPKILFAISMTGFILTVFLRILWTSAVVKYLFCKCCKKTIFHPSSTDQHMYKASTPPGVENRNLEKLQLILPASISTKAVQKYYGSHT